jgi:hypothetical protein
MTCDCVYLILVAFTLLRKSHAEHLYSREWDKIWKIPFPRKCVQWINEAKQDETRQRQILKTIEMLKDNKRGRQQQRSGIT